ncbi:MAG TPA: multifunctional CCA addition/repair protein [Woeseiaceae bacterium]|jgi:tRNA nucleotidyltransferase (CCA-adding enzyme)|nr:multifunctional CCA addition/repair protein [Woeseiaceae bacterium]
MEVYLVGGAVRDELLGLPVTERDWCVVGATPGELEAAGYRQVGKDFPVFLHPRTGEEYALARTERKTGPGYHGFSFHSSPDVTIEDDLRRRDLTVNAMARDSSGILVDPFGGRKDLEQRVLRHVSDSFAEDPVRILRVAKFAARFAPLKFRLAEETAALMAAMVENGEADELVPHRVWKECEAALACARPSVFFDILRQCGALAVVFPEIDALFGVPQPEQWHPEIDCGIHAMMVLEQAAALSREVDVRFAALVHDLGKATTPKNKLPSHPGHERRSVRLIKSMASRMPIPTACRDLALVVAEFHGHCHKAFELRPSTILKVLERTDAFRRRERFDKFLLACEADSRGRTGFEQRPYPQAAWFRQALDAAAEVSARDVLREGMEGAQIGDALRRKRLQALSRLKSDYQAEASSQESAR